jgi:hypothetical protein
VLSDIVKRRSFRATQVTLVTCDRAILQMFFASAISCASRNLKRE